MVKKNSHYNNLNVAVIIFNRIQCRCDPKNLIAICLDGNFNNVSGKISKGVTMPNDFHENFQFLI